METWLNATRSTDDVCHSDFSMAVGIPRCEASHVEQTSPPRFDAREQLGSFLRGSNAARFSVWLWNEHTRKQEKRCKHRNSVVTCMEDFAEDWLATVIPASSFFRSLSGFDAEIK